jgi:hypothetical protein
MPGQNTGLNPDKPLATAPGGGALRPPAAPFAYLDAPEFFKFVADDSARPIAAVKKIGKVAREGDGLTRHFC